MTIVIWGRQHRKIWMQRGIYWDIAILVRFISYEKLLILRVRVPVSLFRTIYLDGEYINATF